MTKHTSGVPLGAWLADLPDERLVRLLELRPDLAQPPPGSISALAARAQARQSVKAATDGLDFLRLAVLDASEGTISSPLQKVLLYCYHYDLATGRYSLAIMRIVQVAGAATVFSLGMLIFVWTRRERRQVG